MNDLRSPFDLRTVELFCAVARASSFTRAGHELGLTQSAVTRQIQHLEQALGASLFHRTTRSVGLTKAGESFLEIATRLLQDFDESLDRFREDHLDQPPKLKLGLSHSITHSHLPGFLSHFRRKNPKASITVRYDSSAAVTEQLVDHRLHLGIFAHPEKAPPNLRLLHSFRDEFVIITPPAGSPGPGSPEAHSWLSLDRQTTTGALLLTWIEGLKPGLKPDIELNSFDLIINLVAQGIGSSIVPRRALRLYGNRLAIRKCEPRKPLYRKIGVYCRRSKTRAPLLDAFVKSILFGWKAPLGRSGTISATV
jgi:DNA-binding transcriptional LysR family regulator